MTDKIEVPQCFVRLVAAAKGLSHGSDWNNGTHAKLHGYRQKLLDAFSGTPPPTCCYECATPIQRMSWMIVCPHCGNKRCPHAENHRNACTGSNAPNQTASPCCNNPAQCWEPCGDLGKSAEHAQPEPVGDELTRLRKDVDNAMESARTMYHTEGSMYHEGRRVAYQQCLAWIDAALASEKREGE